MILEIPDLEKVIENPTPEDLMSGLKSLDGGPLSDSCIDLDAGDLTWIQAIGCEKWGFDLEFLLGTHEGIRLGGGCDPTDSWGG